MFDLSVSSDDSSRGQCNYPCGYISGGYLGILLMFVLIGVCFGVYALAKLVGYYWDKFNERRALDATNEIFDL